MTMPPPPSRSLRLNDGSRPSRLELDARATGERDGPVPPAHQEALAAARSQMPPFDWAILQARAHQIAQQPIPIPPPPLSPPIPWWRQWLSLPLLLPVAVAALALALVVVKPATEMGSRTRGIQAVPEAYLETFVLRDGVGQPWSPEVRLSAGDRVQFAYDAQGQGETLVLLSMDGEGVLSVFWPESGDVPVAAVPMGRTLLEGSVELDDADGPEVFVAVFGAQSVSAASDQVWARWQAAGVAGLQALDDASPEVAVVIIERAE